MARTGKRLRNLYEGIDRHASYKVAEAVKIVKDGAKAKFDESIEVSLNLGLDTRHSDQMVRGAVSLPHGSGKNVRVAVFAKDDKAEDARKAGADIVGADDLAEKVQKGEMNFDRVIATPDMMPVVGKLGKILGPRGLMPNPKLGTVTADVTEAVAAAKGGQVQYRTEKAGVVHASIGKASFSAEAIEENLRAFVNTINKARPSGCKGIYLKKICLCSTMGPGVKLDIADLVASQGATAE